MTKAHFSDRRTINVVVRNGEKFTLEPLVAVPEGEQQWVSDALVYYFDKNFTDDKLSMVYWVLMDMMGKHGFSFTYVGSDQSRERERIGAKIRQLRQEKGLDAKKLAALANIDAANLSRIEKGKYSVGFDVLTKIAQVLDARVDLV